MVTIGSRIRALPGNPATHTVSKVERAPIGTEFGMAADARV